MAEPSQVKTALDAIAATIATSRSMRSQAKAQLLSARNQLASIPTVHANIISTIDGYVPSGAMETLAKDEKAKLQTEFLALKSALETELSALGVSYT
jgi:hypothetical protein